MSYSYRRGAMSVGKQTVLPTDEVIIHSAASFKQTGVKTTGVKPSYNVTQQSQYLVIFHATPPADVTGSSPLHRRFTSALAFDVQAACYI